MPEDWILQIPKRKVRWTRSQWEGHGVHFDTSPEQSPRYRHNNWKTIAEKLEAWEIKKNEFYDSTSSSPCKLQVSTDSSDENHEMNTSPSFYMNTTSPENRSPTIVIHVKCTSIKNNENSTTSTLVTSVPFTATNSFDNSTVSTSATSPPQYSTMTSHNCNISDYTLSDDLMEDDSLSNRYVTIPFEDADLFPDPPSEEECDIQECPVASFGPLQPIEYLSSDTDGVIVNGKEPLLLCNRPLTEVESYQQENQKLREELHLARNNLSRALTLDQRNQLDIAVDYINDLFTKFWYRHGWG